MVRDLKIDAFIDAYAVPKVEGTLKLAKEGLVPGGARANRDFLQGKLVFTKEIDEAVIELLCDPQTSGGLLMAVKKERVEEALSLLKNQRLTYAAVIGEIAPDAGKGRVVLR